MTILAIDPGTEQSGYCIYDDGCVRESGVLANADMLIRVQQWPAQRLAIEMIASYGMAVGREVFETCVWIGRFQQAWRYPNAAELVYRKDVKMHLCGSTKAKDANIRTRIIDLFGGKDRAIGRKASPGPLYGVRSHAWAALAVAITARGIE